MEDSLPIEMDYTPVNDYIINAQIRDKNIPRKTKVKEINPPNNAA